MELSSIDLNKWLRSYGEAWTNQDPEAITPLFSADAAYYETAFCEPMQGREAIRNYWTEGAGISQKDIRFEYRRLAVTGDLGIDHWRASFTRVRSGAAVELDGILSVRPDDHGRCVEFREWWHRKEGH